MEKYVKIVKYNCLTKTYYKVIYGLVKEEIFFESSDSEFLLKGKFYSKDIDENGKFLNGGYIDADGVYAVYKIVDLYREVTKEEFEHFKTNLINEIIAYEKNNTKH